MTRKIKNRFVHLRRPGAEDSIGLSVHRNYRHCHGRRMQVHFSRLPRLGGKNTIPQERGNYRLVLGGEGVTQRTGALRSGDHLMRWVLLMEGGCEELAAEEL